MKSCPRLVSPAPKSPGKRWSASMGGCNGAAGVPSSNSSTSSELALLCVAARGVNRPAAFLGRRTRFGLDSVMGRPKYTPSRWAPLMCERVRGWGGIQGRATGGQAGNRRWGGSDGSPSGSPGRRSSLVRDREGSPGNGEALSDRKDVKRVVTRRRPAERRDAKGREGGRSGKNEGKRKEAFPAERLSLCRTDGKLAEREVVFL